MNETKARTIRYFDTIYAAMATSTVYGEYCRQVYGVPLLQFNRADKAQLDLLLDELQITADHKVLDLGCGLGGIGDWG